MDTQQFRMPVFVGHVFKQDQLDDLRYALNAAFTDVDFLELVYADTARYHGALFPKIAQLIDSALFCIFDVSEQNTNVFLELGYALGRGKMSIPIIRSGATVPSDIAGMERISYGSYKELTETIKTKVQGFLFSAINRRGGMVRLAHNEFMWYLRNHKGGQTVDVDSMKSDLRPHDVSGLEIDETIQLWKREGFMSEENGTTIVTPLGEDFVLSMISQHPELSKRDRG